MVTVLTHFLCRCLVAAVAFNLVFVADAGAQRGEKVNIAIFNLEDATGWVGPYGFLGRAAAEELGVQLESTGMFRVTGSIRVEEALADQNLQADEPVTPAEALKIGRLLGAQVVLTGTVTQFMVREVSGGLSRFTGTYTQAETALDVRILETSNGKQVFGESGQGRKRLGLGSIDVMKGFFEERGPGSAAEGKDAQEALRPAIEEVVKKVSSQADRFASIEPALPVGEIVGGSGDSVYINLGENSGVVVGQQFEVHRVVDEIKDRDGNVLDQLTEKVGLVEVTRVLSQSSVCRVVEGEATEGDAVQGAIIEA